MLKLLITGVCGFVGSTIAKEFREHHSNYQIIGIDNLTRRGSESNLAHLKRHGIEFHHGDLRVQSDIDSLPNCDWVVDAAANASVLAGADGQTSSRQLMEHNLVGTINLLEYCKSRKAGFALLSTSRVYSIDALSKIPIRVHAEAFTPDLQRLATDPIAGMSAQGVSESFSTQAPLSLYGASKLASEAVALEYGHTFDFPVWINRCGVMAGAGQFGRPDQGIFAYWIHSHSQRKPLRYIGFDGLGHQVRDCLHPADLVPLLSKQFSEPQRSNKPRISNVSGGIESAMSLRQLTAWCESQFGPNAVASDPSSRRFDIPWCVLDATQTRTTWNWSPQKSTIEILTEIAAHAKANPNWLESSQLTSQP